MAAGDHLHWACEPFATKEEFYASNCDCGVTTPADDALVERMLDASTDRLTILSGHTLKGICSQTVEHCRECMCAGFCSCDLDTIWLESPLVNVTSVVMEAEPAYVFDKMDFRIVDDEGIAWARSEDRAWPSGLITIGFSWGRSVDEIVKGYVIDLACAAIRIMRSQEGKLGSQQGSVQRQGIALNRRPTSFFADLVQQAVTDRPWMAEFLATYNPTRAVVPTGVWSADDDELHVVRTMP